MNENIIQSSIQDFINGNRKEAIEKLKSYVKKNPSNFSAIYNLGYFYQQINQNKKAEEYYLKAISINSNHWESKINLTIIYIESKNFELALKYVNGVLKIKKDYQPALRDKALILYNLNDYKKALSLADLSVKQNTKDYIALNTLALIHIALSNLSQARECLLKAIKLNNKYELSFVNLGRCFELMNLPTDAFKCFLIAEKINPHSMLSLNNIGGYYLDQGMYAKALSYFMKAHSIDKSNMLVLSNLAKVNFYLDNYGLAEKYINDCLKLDSSNDDYRKTYAIFLLKQKKYDKAWEYYEGRLRLSEFSNKNLHAKKIKDFLWDGRKVDKNEKILVIKEQGIGDEILYGTIYADLFNNFANVKIESDPKLINLFKKTFPQQKSNFHSYGYFSSDIKKLSHFDIVMYAGSLGRIFRKKESDFSNQNLFSINSNKTKKILEKINSNYKIGISWKSFREKISISNAKSISLKNLSSIIDLPRITLINLQYGDVKKELMNFNAESKNKIVTIDSVDISDDLESVLDLLNNLDLFITISNTTAHLAGALGVETWLITPQNHASFHYWNQLNDKTPWYNNVKIYNTGKGIENTILEITKDLKNKFKINV